MIAEVVCPIPLFKSFDYLIPEFLKEIPASHLLGRRVLISFGFKKTVGLISKIKDSSEAPLGKLKPLISLIDGEPLLSPELIQLGEWLSMRYVSSLGEGLFALLPPGRDKPGYFQQSPPSGPVQTENLEPVDSAPSHTPEQTEAVQKIKNSFSDDSASVFLLRGVAAAGKTEVYMAAIQEALKRGRTALFLVPEIGLAEQTALTLKNRFGESKVLLFHSQVSLKERVQDWWRIKRGNCPIVIGPRSTVLVPLANIGVIIVDEEHDSAYKEDRKPRLHVRDVAIKRGQLSHCPVIFGDATPSLELYERTLTGQAIPIEISERAISSALPAIRLIDLKKEKAPGLLSPSLVEEMASRFKIREQTILFLNRRGFFRYLKCPHCGWLARCPQCGITLVRHKASSGKPGAKEAGYWCHYCSTVLPAVNKCPSCGKTELFAGGFGTERIEAEVQKQFPWVHVIRWDRDTAARPGQHKKIFEDFSKGKYDVLIGTQLVAQGFNFPKVTLVGVLDADAQLHIPDFRSAERTYQLITQVAGRSGRADVTGTVLVQTHHPDHYAMSFASKMDYLGFVEKELKFREELSYPPFRHLVQIVASGKKFEEEMNRLLHWLETGKGGETSIGILGPSPVKKTKKKGLNQLQILLKVPKGSFDSFLVELRAFLAVRSQAFFINVDPESLS